MTLKDISIITDIGNKRRINEYSTLGLGTSISRAMLYNRKDIIPRAPTHSLYPSSMLIHNARTIRPLLHFTAVAVEFENRMCVPASSPSLPLSPYAGVELNPTWKSSSSFGVADPFVRNRTSELAGNCCPRKERKRITPYSSSPVVAWRIYSGIHEASRKSTVCHLTAIRRH